MSELINAIDRLNATMRRQNHILSEVLVNDEKIRKEYESKREDNR